MEKYTVIKEYVRREIVKENYLIKRKVYLGISVIIFVTIE